MKKDQQIRVDPPPLFWAMPESKRSLSVDGFPYFCCSPALLHRLPLSPDITHRALIDQLQNQPPFSNILNEGPIWKRADHTFISPLGIKTLCAHLLQN